MQVVDAQAALVKVDQQKPPTVEVELHGWSAPLGMLTATRALAGL